MTLLPPASPLPPSLAISHIHHVCFISKHTPSHPRLSPDFDSAVTARDGFGTSLGPSGDVYVGCYASGARSGAGALRSANGTTCGLHSPSNLPCTRHHTNHHSIHHRPPLPLPTRYAGDWAASQRHGEGLMIYADGCKYEGSWKYGKRHGKATPPPSPRAISTRSPRDLRAPSLRHLRAISARSRRIYRPHGAGCGTYTYANGDTYTGEWSAGAKEGSGRYRQHATGVTYQVRSPSPLLLFSSSPLYFLSSSLLFTSSSLYFLSSSRLLLPLLFSSSPLLLISIRRISAPTLIPLARVACPRGSG